MFKGPVLFPCKQFQEGFSPLNTSEEHIWREVCHTRLIPEPRRVEGRLMGLHFNQWRRYHEAKCNIPMLVYYYF